MTEEQKEAMKILQTVVDQAVAKGIFGNAGSVVQAQNALSIVTAGLQPKQEKK